MRPSPGPSEIEAARVADATIAAAGAIATAQLTFAKVVSQAEADCADEIAAADSALQKAKAKADADAATAIAKAEVQKLIADATAELVCAARIENAVTAAGEAFVKSESGRCLLAGGDEQRRSRAESDAGAGGELSRPEKAEGSRPTWSLPPRG